MTDTVVAEGQVKFRDGKKWKTRWVVLQKPSPVADCLILLVYKKKKRRRNSRRKEKLSVTLEGICGVEPGPGFDGVSYTLSILCLAHTQVLGFSSWDALLAWDTNIRYSLGEVHRFCVSVGAGTKLESGPASLHLCNNLLVLSRGPPHTVIGHWKLSALRRYGAVPHGFVFEGGTRCGLSSAYSCSSSVAGDDHSLSSSSSCQSDASYGRRLACWVEPSVRPHLSGEMAASSSTLKALTRSDDRLYDGMTGGRLAYAQLHPRCLHDSGRQSSLDSGIGIATGSQSSYCGSYSSRTGSLEIQGAGKELCSPLPEQSSTSSCSGASRRHSAEYQTPGLLRLWYNTPRRLLQPQAEPPALPALGRAENQGMGGVQVQTAISRLKAQRQASMQRSHSWGSESAPSVEREGTPTPLQVFGVNQGCQGWSDYITAEQLRSVRSRHSTQVTSSPPADLAPCRTAATLAEPPLCVEGSFGEWRGQRMRMLSPPPSSPPPPPPVTSLLHRPTSASASLQSPVKAPPCAWLHAGPRWGGAGKCANVSRSLLSAEELLNMQPERQEPSSAPLSRPHGAARGGDLQKPNPPHQVPSTGHGSGS
ncbi:protein Dok-7 isoform X6 [Oryzias melastigma]|uniref:protein Dok-7 isoform X6 n=1 Tax=Oryzias melastigma TaxID=30732 RepID=UPI00168CC17C|nr:protein Dok-7 isoform X6 [Oryzias melastigma]